MDEIKPHTRTKWNYLRKYLHAYTTIISCWFKRFYYIDGFAGEGRYNEDFGSPLIALSLKFPFTNYILIENKPKRFDKLKENTKPFLNSRTTVRRKKEDEETKQINVELECIDANKYIKEKLQDIPDKPCFILLDPYGTELKIESVITCSKKEHVELLINFSSMGVIRNIDENPKLVTEYYGNEEWKKIQKRAINRAQLYTDLYIKNIKDYFEYVVAVPIKNEKNSSIYSLIYASNNDKGYKIMKDVMKQNEKQSKLGGF